MNAKLPFLTLILFAQPLIADDSTTEAAIGGGIGGVVGAAIGNEIGGRDGAIIGGALGAAAGVTVTTQDDSKNKPNSQAPGTYYQAPQNPHPSQYHCPPGQRKNGRC